MYRCSDSTAAIAAALAKAQADLVNPEKTLTGTIAEATGNRVFRYASLASGLDIIRKCLAGQEIAAIQSTIVDKETGIVRLVTTLAHASGEWLASEWPVCPISDIAAPRRMGAALTYARRYSLFSLVGIAGEDDLDAPPNLSARPLRADETRGSPKLNGTRTNGSVAPNQKRSGSSALAPVDSVAVRDQLLMQLEALVADDDLLAWASTSLPIKNTLAPADALAVEAVYAAKLNAIQDDALREPASVLHDPPSPSASKLNVSQGPELEHAEAGETADSERRTARSASTKTRQSAHIDKSVLAIGAPKRHRNKNHLKFVASRACLICGRQPCDAHHLRFAQTRGLGLKVSDEFTVPLCRIHHRELHKTPDEQGWWKLFTIDALKVANDLWRTTQLHRGSFDALKSQNTAPNALK